MLIGGFESVIHGRTRLRIYALPEEFLTYKIFRTRQTSLFVDSCPAFFCKEVNVMDVLTGKIRTVYLKYFWSAFGSTMISSIYSLVDMAVVGQYQGPQGTAALAVVAPLWNIIYSLGLLMGIGGGVLFSMEKGKGQVAGKRPNEYFSASMIGSVLFAVMAWVLILFCQKPVLYTFGADESLLVLAQNYLKPIQYVFPVFLFNQALAAFLRNDGAPALATDGVIIGGIFNIFGDYFFVFGLNMGIEGAGLATGLGALITFGILMIHFFTRKNTLKLMLPHHFFHKFGRILVTGFSSFFMDLAMGILTILFNQQIMKYLGGDALAIYGPIINISTIVQCCAYAVGQAAQPILSTNYGAGLYSRVKETLRYALYTVSIFSILWTAFSVAVPNAYIYLFMKPTESILRMAPGIIRAYSLSFLLLPLNIFSTYYFQALLKPKAAFVISILRGFLISGGLILLLPLFLNADSIWFAMPVTELVTAVYVVKMIRHYTDNL